MQWIRALMALSIEVSSQRLEIIMRSELTEIQSNLSKAFEYFLKKDSSNEIFFT